jgi:NAD(P)H-dependent FMN reductase
MKIQVILGSTRPQRQSEKIGRWVLEQTSRDSALELELIDLKDWPLPFYQEESGLTSLKGELSIDLAKKWQEKVKEADGYIIVTPEYNHGYSAILKNALDYAYYEWNNKPIAFVSYGGSAGGSRAVEQLRQVAIELQMAPIRDAIHIPAIWASFDEEGKLKDIEMYNEKLDGLIKQLLWWTKALKAAREN